MPDTIVEQESARPRRETVFRLESLVQSQVGLQQYAAWVRAHVAEDPKLSQTLTIGMRYQAAVDYVVYPTRLVVHQRTGGTGEGSFLIRPYGVDKVRILELDTDLSPTVHLQSQTIEFGGQQAHKVELTTNFPDQGVYHGRVRVLTDSSRHPEFVLPLDVRVVNARDERGDAVLLDGSDGRNKATARVVLPIGATESTQDAHRIVFEPPLSGLYGRIVKTGSSLSVDITILFSAEIPPAGVSEMVIADQEGSERARYDIIWIGSFRELAATTK